MKKIKVLITLIVAMSLANCEDKDYDSAIEPGDVPLSVSFAKATDTYNIDPADPVYKVAVTSTQVSNVDRTFTVIFNEEDSDENILPGEFSANNTVTIPAGSYIGYGDITFDFDAAPAGDPKIAVFDLVLPDGAGVRNETKDQITINYKQLCVFTSAQIKFTFDNYSEETSWELYNSSSEVVGSGEFEADMTSAIADLCLEDGAYTLVVYDSYGDGMCCSGGNGSYQVVVDGVVVHQGNGQFTTFDIAEFTVGN